MRGPFLSKTPIPFEQLHLPPVGVEHEGHVASAGAGLQVAGYGDARCLQLGEQVTQPAYVQGDVFGPVGVWRRRFAQHLKELQAALAQPHHAPAVAFVGGQVFFDDAAQPGVEGQDRAEVTGQEGNVLEHRPKHRGRLGQAAGNLGV